MAARYHPYERTAKGAPFQATHPQQIAGHHMPHMTPNHHVVPNRMAPHLMPQQQFIPQVFPIPLATPAKHVCARATNILQRGSADGGATITISIKNNHMHLNVYMLWCATGTELRPDELSRISCGTRAAVGDSLERRREALLLQPFHPTVDMGTAA
jgi:hypothetical protein